MLQEFDSAQEALDKRQKGHRSLKAGILARLSNQPWPSPNPTPSKPTSAICSPVII